MQYTRLSNWFPLFFTNWFLPRLSLATGVISVASVLFTLDIDATMNPRAQEKFDAIFVLPFGHNFQWLLLGFGVLFVASLLARGVSKGPSRSWYWLARKTPKLASAFNTVFGLLLVPMVVALSGLNMLPGNQATPGVFAYAVLFVVIGAAFHYLEVLDNHPRHCLTYSVTGFPEQTEAMFHHATTVRLNEVLSHVPWHDEPVPSIETSDRHVSIVVPIYLEASQWPDDKLQSLQKYMSAIELEWEQCGYIWTRTLSRGLATRLIHSCNQV